MNSMVPCSTHLGVVARERIAGEQPAPKHEPSLPHAGERGAENPLSPPLHLAAPRCPFNRAESGLNRAGFMPFLVHLHLFFASRGRLLLVLPVSKIKNGILQHLQPFRMTTEGFAGEMSGGFRFLFVSEYDSGSSLCSLTLLPLTEIVSTDSVTHVNELAIFYTGNLLVKVALTVNLSAPSFGLATMDCVNFSNTAPHPSPARTQTSSLMTALPESGPQQHQASPPQKPE